MPNDIDFSAEQAKDLVEESLYEFYKNDAILLDYDTEDDAVAERCMVFRIGWYLHDKLKETAIVPNLTVDAEYNRNFEHPKEMYSQILAKTKNAIPDLLVHQRRSNKYNLIYFEFKKGMPQKADRALDEEKLAYFTDVNNEYKYRYGFYIWLYKRYAKIRIYINGKEKSHLDYTWDYKGPVDL